MDAGLRPEAVEAGPHVGCFGPFDEWHLEFRNSFRHLAFDFGTWLGQRAIVIAPPLFQARFVTIGSVSDSMSGDGVK